MRNFAVLIGCMLFSVAALAETSDNKSSSGKEVSTGGGFSGSGSSSSDIKGANNQIGIQFISTMVDYTETGNGQAGNPSGTLDTESGPVQGNAYFISVMNDALLGNDYFKMMYDHSNGETNYVGAAQGGVFGSVASTSSATFTNFSARYGKGFALRNSSMLTPYVEYGSHKWERGVNFGETYTNNYYGLGLLHQYSLANSLVLAVDAMYGHTNASAIVITSGPGLNGFSGPLGDSALYRIGISLDYAVGNRLHGTLGVDYTAFAYGISAAYPSGNLFALEPDSRTYYTTLRCGLGWGF